MNILTSEQYAAHQERSRRWSLSLDAGLAGKPRPEGVVEMAYLSGCARRRAAAGEIIGFVCQSSRCSACGEQNWGWRLGCACWSTAPRTTLAPEGVSMIYGAQVEAGSDPDVPEATFIEIERLRALVAGGREILDIMRGTPVPLTP